jgi:cytochrome c biogenesis protein CcmG, thiol:disulfide interchange protein DsbE
MKYLLLIGSILFFQINLNAQSIKNLKLKTVDDKRFEIKEHLDQGPIVFSFWSTWCSSCQDKLKALKKIFDKYQKKGLKVFAISVDSPKSLSKVKIYVKKLNLPYIFLVDPNGEQSKKLHVNEFPYTLISNSSGNIVYSQRGYRKGDVNEIDEKISMLISSIK